MSSGTGQGIPGRPDLGAWLGPAWAQPQDRNGTYRDGCTSRRCRL